MAPSEEQQKKRQRNAEDADAKMIRRKFKFKRIASTAEEPFVQACLNGQVANVEFMLPFSGKYVEEALAELDKLSPEDVNPEILRLLSQKRLSSPVDCAR